MQLYDPKHIGAPGRGLFNAGERRRLLLLIAIAILFIGGVVATKLQLAERSDARVEAPAQFHQQPLPTEVALPDIDVAALEAAANDERPEQRVVLPGEALEAGFAQSKGVSDGVFAALGGRELSARIASRIVEAPREHRGQLLRARGFVDGMRRLANPNSPNDPRYFVRGHLEDGAPLYFAVKEIVGLAPVPGDFVRMDGLFVRLQREEVDGNWCEAPLFVGPRMYESSPELAPVKELDAQSLAMVQDDGVANGLAGLDQDAYWQLLSYAKNLEPGMIDWEATPILDNQTIQSISSDGTAWRGKPVRASRARMLDLWKQSQAENPLRMDHVVTGWFCGTDWSGQAKVAQFVAPFGEVMQDVRKDVSLRGFFYKNLAYTPRDGGVAVAPFFVLQSLEPAVTPADVGMEQLAYIVAGSLGALAIGIFVLMRRDKQNSDALEADLLLRRRERRQKLSPAEKT